MENSTKDIEPDWEGNRNRRFSELKDCQNSKGLDSCLKCKLIIDCEVRDNYVKAVYENMNRGTNGGFEF